MKSVGNATQIQLTSNLETTQRNGLQSHREAQRLDYITRRQFRLSGPILVRRRLIGLARRVVLLNHESIAARGRGEGWGWGSVWQGGVGWDDGKEDCMTQSDPM